MDPNEIVQRLAQCTSVEQKPSLRPKAGNGLFARCDLQPGDHIDGVLSLFVNDFCTYREFTMTAAHRFETAAHERRFNVYRSVSSSKANVEWPAVKARAFLIGADFRLALDPAHNVISDLVVTRFIPAGSEIYRSYDLEWAAITLGQVVRKDGYSDMLQRLMDDVFEWMLHQVTREQFLMLAFNFQNHCQNQDAYVQLLKDSRLSQMLLEVFRECRRLGEWTV